MAQEWITSEEAAQIVGVTPHQVVVFGSLVRESGFTGWSAVDIAAWGLAPEDTFRAMGMLMDLPREIPVNLAQVQPPANFFSLRT
jgi:uncharacterized protein